MSTRRPARECANLLMADLQKFGPSTRTALYARMGLTANEMHSALRTLQRADVRQRTPFMIAQALLSDTEHLIIAIGVASADDLITRIEAGLAEVRRRHAQ